MLKRDLAAALLLALSIPKPSAAADKKDNGQSPTAPTQAQTQQFVTRLAQTTTGLMTKDAVQLKNALQATNAATWALWDLLSDMSRRKRAGEAKPAPDAALADAYLRLRMRCNTGDLVFRGSSHITSSKIYPGDEEFARAAGGALADVRRRSAAWAKNQYALDPGPRDSVTRAFESARRQMVFRLRRHDADGPDQPPPPTPGESVYLQKASDEMNDTSYVLPPWPTSQRPE
ncbi:MAG: hypothetical protein ACHQ49_07970 [Elusimicrobiota bacterium]